MQQRSTDISSQPLDEFCCTDEAVTSLYITRDPDGRERSSPPLGRSTSTSLIPSPTPLDESPTDNNFSVHVTQGVPIVNSATENIDSGFCSWTGNNSCQVKYSPASAYTASENRPPITAGACVTSTFGGANSFPQLSNLQCINALNEELSDTMFVGIMGDDRVDAIDQDEVPTNRTQLFRPLTSDAAPVTTGAFSPVQTGISSNTTIHHPVAVLATSCRSQNTVSSKAARKYHSKLRRSIATQTPTDATMWYRWRPGSAPLHGTSVAEEEEDEDTNEIEIPNIDALQPCGGLDQMIGSSEASSVVPNRYSLRLNRATTDHHNSFIFTEGPSIRRRHHCPAARMASRRSSLCEPCWRHIPRCGQPTSRQMPIANRITSVGSVVTSGAALTITHADSSLRSPYALRPIDPIVSMTASPRMPDVVPQPAVSPQFSIILHSNSGDTRLSHGGTIANLRPASVPLQSVPATQATSLPGASIQLGRNGGTDASQLHVETSQRLDDSGSTWISHGGSSFPLSHRYRLSLLARRMAHVADELDSGRSAPSTSRRSLPVGSMVYRGSNGQNGNDNRHTSLSAANSLWRISSSLVSLVQAPIDYVSRWLHTSRPLALVSSSFSEARETGIRDGGSASYMGLSMRRRADTYTGAPPYRNIVGNYHRPLAVHPTSQMGIHPDFLPNHGPIDQVRYYHNPFRRDDRRRHSGSFSLGPEQSPFAGGVFLFDSEPPSR